MQDDSDLITPLEHVTRQREPSNLTRPRSTFQRPKSAFERDTGAQRPKPPSPPLLSSPHGNHFAVDLSKIRALPGLERDNLETNYSLSNTRATLTLQALALRLRSCDEEEREDALATLDEIVDGAFGEDGSRLGEDLRNVGAISLLAELLADPDQVIRQMSLRLLGNLCSDAVDARSGITKALLLPHALPIFSFVYGGDESILIVACGVLQNLTAERTWAQLAVVHGVQQRLEELVAMHRGNADGHLIVRYASGALRNITSCMPAGLHGRTGLSASTRALISQRGNEHRLEAQEQKRAMGILTKAILRVPPERRRQWQELGREHRRAKEEQEQLEASDTASVCSSSCSAATVWSYGSLLSSRPSSACSQDSCASGSPLRAVRARMDDGSGGTGPRPRPASAFARSGGGGGTFYGLRAHAGSPLHAIRGRLYNQS